MNQPETTTEQNPRADLIAALRAFVDLLEAHPSLPAPHSVYAQHTRLDLDDDGRRLIADAAAVLGIAHDGWTRNGSHHRSSEDYTSVRYQVGAQRTGEHDDRWEVIYVIHGSVDHGEAGDQ